MALKPVLDSLEGVPDVLHEHYAKQEDGKFRLAVTGLVPKERLDEFRDNNTTLLKQNKDLADRLAKYDDDEIEDLRKKAASGKGPTPEEIDKLVEERTGKMRKKHDEEVNAYKTREGTLRSRYEREVIDKGLIAAAVAAGCVETAVDDIVARGRATFVLDEEERVVPRGRDGKVIYGADGEPLSMKEWMQGLAQGAPHLFKASSGGGAGGNGGGGASSGVRSKAELTTPKMKSDFIAKHGLEKFRALPATVK